jgi:hypothetical protein
MEKVLAIAFMIVIVVTTVWVLVGLNSGLSYQQKDTKAHKGRCKEKTEFSRLSSVAQYDFSWKDIEPYTEDQIPFKDFGSYKVPHLTSVIECRRFFLFLIQKYGFQLEPNDVTILGVKYRLMINLDDMHAPSCIFFEFFDNRLMPGNNVYPYYYYSELDERHVLNNIHYCNLPVRLSANSDRQQVSVPRKFIATKTSYRVVHEYTESEKHYRTEIVGGSAVKKFIEGLPDFFISTIITIKAINRIIEKGEQP